MKLYILRHGEVGKRPLPGSKSSEKPLTVAGEREVQEVSRAVMELGLKFDVIASSPLKAAYQTAEIVSSAWSQLKAKDKGKNIMTGNNIEKWDELKPEGKRELLWKRLSNINSHSSILIVGHEPQIGEMISEIMLAGHDDKGNIRLKKCGLAKVEILSFKPRIKGQLDWLITPKMLKRMIN